MYPPSFGVAARVTAGSGYRLGLGLRRRHAIETLRHDVLGTQALHPELRVEREPVRERRHGDGLHVLGRDEVAARERRQAARELQQRERAARARADLEARSSSRVAATMSTM